MQVAKSKGPFRAQSSKLYKIHTKKNLHDYFYQLAKFHDQIIYDWKGIFKNVLYLLC